MLVAALEKKQTTATETKAITTRFEVKELDAEARTFEGLASTWDRDLGDDVIHPGAFKRTLSHWRQSKRALPLLDQHNYHTVRSVVGKLLDARETDEGLWTKWQVIDGPDGDEILRRLKGGYVDGLSIGYRPVKYDFEESDDARWGEIRHLREVELKEVSVVIWGMNPNALVDTDSVKALIQAARDGRLTDEPKDERRALLDDSPAPDAPDTGTPDPEEPKGLAPEEQAALRAKILRLKLRRLATRA